MGPDFFFGTEEVNNNLYLHLQVGGFGAHGVTNQLSYFFSGAIESGKWFHLTRSQLHHYLFLHIDNTLIP